MKPGSTTVHHNQSECQWVGSVLTKRHHNNFEKGHRWKYYGYFFLGQRWNFLQQISTTRIDNHFCIIFWHSLISTTGIKWSQIKKLSQPIRLMHYSTWPHTASNKSFPHKYKVESIRSSTLFTRLSFFKLLFVPRLEKITWGKTFFDVCCTMWSGIGILQKIEHWMVLRRYSKIMYRYN